MNVSDIIKRHVADTPDKTAIIFGERRVSYSQLDALITRTADGLLKTELKRGRDLVIVGIPDDLKGEAPKAFIQLNQGETAT